MTPSSDARSFGAGMGADALILVFVIAFVAVIHRLGLGDYPHARDQAALVFGLILLCSHLLGRLGARAGLPRLIGYLAAGVLMGPFVMGRLSGASALIPPEAAEELSFLNSVALGLIAFTAGGELRVVDVLPRWRGILPVTLALCVSIMGLCLLALVPAALGAGIFGDLPGATALSGAVIVAAIAMASSPAIVVSVLVELRARGPLTTTILGVTVVKDVVVIMTFSLAVVAAKMMAGGEAGWKVVALVPWEVVGSVGLGLLMGEALRRYMGAVGRELPFVLLGVAFAAVELARELHLSGLLLCLSAGFYVVNFSTKGETLLRALERFTLPVFVLFFTLAGAELRLDAVTDAWPAVLLVVAVRLGATWLGARVGTRIAGEDEKLRKHLWAGFVPQAAVGLGLVAILRVEIPSLAAVVEPVIVGAIAVNMIVGPILLRRAILAAGEAHAEE